MKKAYLKAGWFVFPLVLIWMALELFYRSVPNNYTFKAEQIKQQSAEIETLVFGDSHAFYAVNPEYLELNAYNFSNISQTIYFDKLLFDKYVTVLPRLKYVILTVNYTSLSQVDNTMEDVWRKYFYANCMDLNVPIISKVDPKYYSLACTQRFSKSVDLVSDYINNGTLINCNNSGWGIDRPVENSLDLIKTSNYTARKHEDGLLDFNLNTMRLQALINSCKLRNIQVVLVSFPVYRVYSDLLNKAKVEKMFATCNYLAQTNDNTIYLNLFNDRKFKPEDFFDGNHLNSLGAEKCSKLLNAYLH